ncbi:FHA domain-containing protein DDL-like [Zingiber officinale]|uniref:FHA domain-containing protein n=1 Tax=Zingiber officinale TaxID=94328 RepID=A0A8J5GYL9_ZINOF|nr:FHA domain-containing protein DDL-like [Zingiber officinale]KAG6516866.1 hypothetical protein ZIOFF_020239 [Zingiber officinale]
MTSAVERRERRRMVSSDRSTPPPVRVRHSPHRKASSRRDVSPGYPKSSRMSRSPSPRTKRLRRAQAERDTHRVPDRELERSSGREDIDKGRYKERKLLKENNDGSRSPEGRSYRERHRSRSPARVSAAGVRNEVERKTSPAEYSRNNEDDSLAKMKEAEKALEAKEKQKPSFELSGKLAEETNKVRGITLLFNEPADARKPDIRWRLYVFKAGEMLNEPLYVHRQTCYLFGRERRVADIPTDHPSCSKQHAVIQYRLVEKEQPDGLMSKQVRPYLMDLGSTNGTFVNDNRIEPQRYYELFEKDTIKFGNSSREYVLLHENSTT